MRTRQWIGLGLAGALVAAACTSGGGENTTRSLPDLRLTAALSTFDSCDALLVHLKEVAIERVGPYGFGGSYYPYLLEGDAAMMAEEDRAVPSTPAPGDASKGGESSPEHSTTNVQEQGVDEPDVVKTDGRRIVAVVGNALRVVVLGGEPRVAGTLRLPDDASAWEFLLDGDRVILFGTQYSSMPVEAATGFSPVQGQVETTIVAVDISDPAAPKVLDQLTIQGEYRSARLVDGVPRVVVRSQPLLEGFVYPQGPNGEDSAEAANRGVIERSTLDQWLPHVRREGGDETRVVGCDRVFAPQEFAGFGMVSVLSIPFGDRLEPDAVSVLAETETVYASTSDLYIASTAWVDPAVQNDPKALEELDDGYDTTIHQFTLEESSAQYVASGTVDGSLLDQFSLSEADGRLRVVTTEGTPWGRDEQSESFLTVLEPRDGKLVTAGRVGNMGKGEAVYAVRFTPEVAYVVTFRQTDPFYTVDLSDPANPRVVGELKIPGFSSYLHPLGATRVLGVGQAATEEGRQLGSKVSLFDVSDPAAPKELASWQAPFGSNSAVEYDHRAFLYWEPSRLAVVPVQTYDGSFVGAIGLEVGDSGLAERGRITHERDDVQTGASDCRRVTDEEIRAVLGEDVDVESNLEPGAFAQVCGLDQAGGAVGYSCSSMDAETIASYAGKEEVELPGVGPDDRVELCYPDSMTAPIERTVVVGDTLWTFSQDGLLAGDLATLTPGTWVAW